LYIFEQNNINIPWKTRFSLVSDELVNNSIEYGSLPGDTNECHISFHTKENKLYVTVEIWDTGKGPEAKTSAQMEEIRIRKEQMGFDNYL
jgi:two-component sensor histidine kinase